MGVAKFGGRTLDWAGSQEYNTGNQTMVLFCGRSVFVWGCMAAGEFVKNAFIDSIMDKMLYLNILKDHLKATSKKLGLGSNFLF